MTLLHRSSLLAAIAAATLVVGCQEDDSSAEETGATEELVAPGDGKMDIGEEDVSSAELEEEATAVSDASHEASDAAVEAVEEGEALSGAAQDDAVTEAEQEGTVGAQALDDVLSVERFDRDRAITIVEQSGLDAVRKATLTERLEAASEESPEELSAILEQIRGALGEVPLEGGPASPE